MKPNARMGYARVTLALRLLYTCEFNINIRLSRQLSVCHQSDRMEVLLLSDHSFRDRTASDRHLAVHCIKSELVREVSAQYSPEKGQPGGYKEMSSMLPYL